MTYYQNAAGMPPEQTICFGALIIPRTEINFVQLTTNITTATTTDLYTVPAGKTAIIPVAYTNNVGLAANTTSIAVKISGSYYRISTDNGSTNAQSQARQITYIFNSGETLAFITSTTSQINFRASILEIPNSYGVSSKKITSFTGGGTADTLYTLPANTQAFAWGTPARPISAPVLYISPNIGGSPSYNVYTVPDGDSPGSANQINITTSATSTSVNFQGCGSNLVTPGDRYMVSSTVSTSGQMAWVNIIEIPNILTRQNIIGLPIYESVVLGAFGFNGSQFQTILSLTNISSATTTDLYTVPSGYKLIFRSLQVFTTSGTCTYILKAKLGGTYYNIASPSGTAIAANATNFFGLDGTFVFEAGDSVACETTGSGIAGNIYVIGFLVPDTTPILTAYRTSFSGGGSADTLYSLPADKEALAVTVDFNAPLAALLGTIGLTQTTGSSRAYNVYNVPIGQSAGSTTLATSISGVGNNSSINKQTGLQVAMSLIDSGDKIMISSDSSTSGQFAWINIIEVDA